MRRLTFCLAAASLCLLNLPARAASGNIAAGKESGEPCQACHGENGISTTEGVPSLAGQRDTFLQWQLVFFRSGRRNNEIMTPIASGMSDEDVRNLGAYFASLPSPAATPVPDDNDPLHKQGEAIATQHHCAICHTDTFTGKQGAASLAHQRKDYLVKALADYRSGARPSIGVAAMTEAAAGLSDSDIDALADFLSTFH